jgi:hypothetical protein
VKHFKVIGGLGRSSHFPKTVYVEAYDADVAKVLGAAEIRALITLEDFDGDGGNDRVRGEVVNVTSVEEYDPNKWEGEYE